MLNSLFKTFDRLRNNDEGVTLVEYGVALTLVITVGGVGLVLLGGQISAMMNAAGAAMTP